MDDDFELIKDIDTIVRDSGNFIGIQINRFPDGNIYNSISIGFINKETGEREYYGSFSIPTKKIDRMIKALTQLKEERENMLKEE